MEIIVWYFLGKTWKFHVRALESWGFVVLLKQNKIKTNCYSSLPYLRPACLYRASLCFLPSDSLGLIHQKGGLGLSAAALDTMIRLFPWRRAMELWMSTEGAEKWGREAGLKGKSKRVS